jgi:hypothetical protein
MIDMKTRKFFRLRTAGVALFSALLIAVLITSCDEDDVKKYTGTPYFNIENDPTGLTVGVGGITQSYVVRSNRPWRIVPQSEGDWVKPFPDEGDEDGIFKIIVNENITFDARTMNFAFVVDGKEQPVLFRVDQSANVPYITLPTQLSVPAAGGSVVVNVTSNVNWTYSLTGGSWLTEQSVSPMQVNLIAAENFNIDPRIITMTVTAADYPTVSQTVTITQSSGSIVFEENFSWLSYGSAIFYTTTNETRIDVWTQEQKDRGWTSTVNTTAGSGNTPLLYARQGFVKVGKTAYGGDLISPVLSKITGTQNLIVTFKAIPYMTAAGTKDDNILNVSVIGPGTVSQGQFIIDNWPVYPAEGVLDYCIALWNAPEATRSFTITGATSATQIKFLGWDYYLVGVGAGKNRIFLDDIKVEIAH